MEKCEERKSLPIYCVFYSTEIHETVLKQPIRTEYLIKQKPWGTLGLVIFPMSGNNTFEKSGFADPRFSF